MNERIIDIFTKDALEAARANNTYRSMRLMETPESSHVKIRTANGVSQEQILLASNSYLDLANIDELKQAMAQAVLEWGTGSGGARLTTGNKTPHQELEEFIAKFKGEAMQSLSLAIVAEQDNKKALLITFVDKTVELDVKGVR